MTPAQLATIAQGMRQALAAWAERPFVWTSHTVNGTEIVLSRNLDAWRIALRHVGAFVTPDVVETCMTAFAVPEGTEPEYRKHREPSIHGGTIDVRIVELRWIEAS